MSILPGAVLLGISLCADCFAVSLCASLAATERPSSRRIWGIAVVFAVIQTGLFLAGWGMGRGVSALLSAWLGPVDRILGLVGFLLLLYVGGSMVYEAVRGEEPLLDLNGFWPVVLGGVATSIDALSVGLSYALDAVLWPGTWPVAVSIAAFTFLSVVVGMGFGHAIGARFGRPARLTGGLILIGLGVAMLF